MQHKARVSVAPTVAHGRIDLQFRDPRDGTVLDASNVGNEEEWETRDDIRGNSFWQGVMSAERKEEL